jgi:hypothetical protein
VSKTKWVSTFGELVPYLKTLHDGVAIVYPTGIRPFMDNRGWLYFRTSPKDTRGYWIILSGRSGAAVSGWVARNHHLHGLVESIIMNVGGCWWNITESER